ncbi:hypothetical protein BSZ35_10975 [Salinibacter sp. 10B]|uniref:fasciclin domain-containing protein n=1 Tax=Salinibacter sp. 10B TaxID=1923971 RepID=UPI000CF36422|nr:fasciclin domain-containing protein [Salinibacter sp. 10B]PQJ35044.1 hypothetical protein BSZ35_10975 [Salinibacter sp. 10B]
MTFDIPLFASLLRRWSLLGIGVLALGLVVVGCDNNGGVPAEERTVAGIVSLSQANTSTLAGALEQSDLADSLSNEDTTLTVFAPVDSAFDNIDKEELTENDDLLSEVLTAHVVPGRALTADRIEDGKTVVTMEGDSLTLYVDDGAVQVNGDAVITADIEGTNGVVHLIDEVLLKTADAVDRVRLAPQFGLFSDLVGEGELASALREEDRTVFAPTDQALLEAFDENDNGTLDDDEWPNDAGSTVRYHALQAVYFASDVPPSATEYPTLEGSNVTLKRSDDTVTVNDAAVTSPDIEVENGVLHGIDAVLHPPSQ